VFLVPDRPGCPDVFRHPEDLFIPAVIKKTVPAIEAPFLRYFTLVLVIRI
jgi:hypothetical protein